MSAPLAPIDYLRLALLPRFGGSALRVLHEQGQLDKLHHANAAQLSSWGFKQAQIEAWFNPNWQKIHSCLAWLEQNASHVVGYADDIYPEALRFIPSPPLLLFAQGQIELLHAPQLAMVGSRHASWRGQRQARLLATDFANAGLFVTSGLALGIDAAAHWGALDASEGKTIAVLGSGIGNIYPRRHERLASEIVKRGLLLSEYWPKTPPRAYHFPRRNRLISGLSLGTLVVEAGLPSGSLLSANFAADQGREVFAMPGAADDPLHAGCHQLIREGAKLVTCAQDVFDELTHFTPQAPPSLEKVPSCSHKSLPKQRLLDSVGDEVTAVDALIAHTQLPIDVVLALLTELELEGEVALEAGGYIRLRRRP